MRSLERAARALGILNVGHVPIVVRASALHTAKSFKAALFSAFQAGRSRNTGSPISRATIQQLTGISRRTQSHYEKTNNERRNGQVKAQRNFAVISQDATALRGIRDTVHGAAFLYGGAVVRPLPNTYTHTLKKAGQSRTRKTNRALKGGLVVTGAGQHKPARVFFRDAEAAAKAERDDAHKNNPNAPSRRFYQAGRAYRGAGRWRCT